MKWISVKDKLPDDYDAYYIVLVTNIRPDEDGIIPTWFRIGFKPYELHIARWGREPELVKLYHDRKDFSCDLVAKDHFCECEADSDNITHWLKIPKHPVL